MLILLRTQVERTAKAPIPARRARVGGLCGFRGAAERVPIQQQKTRRCADVRHKNSTEAQRSGFGRKRRCSEMDETCRLRRGEGYGACIDEAARQDKAAGVVRAPRRSHLPAVRAVSGIYEGVPNTAKNSRRALRNEKNPPFQGKQRGSNEKHEVNTEKW